MFTKKSPRVNICTVYQFGRFQVDFVVVPSAALFLSFSLSTVSYEIQLTNAAAAETAEKNENGVCRTHADRATGRQISAKVR